MSKSILTAALCTLSVVAMTTSAAAQDQSAGGSPDPIGYFLGYSVGQQMSQSGFETGDFDFQAMLKGFEDAFAGKEAALSDEQLRETQMKIQALLEQRRTEQMEGKKAEGAQFLAQVAKQEGVKALEGGLLYKELKAGEGPSPSPTDTVKVHYTGKLTDGTVFDSSVQRGEPATFRVNQVIKGWQMALQNMQVGDKWMLYIPSDLAYGERGSQGAIGPNEVLVFEVELLEIQ